MASYKGLENDIIILIEFDKFTEELNNSILYTAMTRVKTKFIHLGEKENVVFRKIHR